MFKRVYAKLNQLDMHIKKLKQAQLNGCTADQTTTVSLFLVSFPCKGVRGKFE